MMIAQRLMLNLLVFVVCLTASFAQAGQATLQVDQKEVTLGETITLTLTVEGDLQEEPELPDVKNLRVAGSGSSQRMSWVNGQYKKDVSYNYAIQAQSPGTYTVPPVSLKIDGQVVASNAVSFTVKNGGGQTGTANAQAGGGDFQQSGDEQGTDLPPVFLKRTFSTTTPYEGQAVLSTVKIYHRVNLSKIDNISERSPDLRVMEIGQSQRKEQIGDVVYNVIEYKQLLLPSLAKDIRVPSFQIRTQMIIPRSRSRGIDDFFSEFFSNGFGQAVEKVVSSLEGRLTVRPLPKEGRPLDDRGLVGQFKVSSSLSKSSLKTGETTTLVISITGHGSLDPLGLLKVDFGPDLKIYADKPEVKDKPGEGGIESSRVYRFALVPGALPAQMNEKNINLGPFKLSYFDPEKEKYELITTELGTLNVQNSGDVLADKSAPDEHLQAGSVKLTVKTLASDLLDLQRDADLSESRVLLQKDWNRAFGLLGSSFGFFILLWVIRRIRSRKSERDRSVAAAAKEFKRTKEELDRQYAKSGASNSEAQLSVYIAELYRAYRLFWGVKFGKSGSALTSKELAVLFKEIDLEESLQKKAQAMAEAIESSVYSARPIQKEEVLQFASLMESLVS